jgi:hypothetical protein
VQDALLGKTKTATIWARQALHVPSIVICGTSDRLLTAQSGGISLAADELES